jgi:hypothetical protein
MRLRLTLASLAALVGLFATAEQASALSCPEPKPEEQFKTAEFHVAGQTRYELRRALATGIKLKVGCAAPCKAIARLYLRARIARRLKLARSSGPVLVAKGSARPTGAALKILHVRFSRHARPRLKWVSKLELSLKLIFTSRPRGTRTTWGPSLTFERRSLTLDYPTRH